MPKKYANRAIIVLEAPWELDAKDANRSSVLPFIEGIAKLAGDTDVLHANFYDQNSLELAAFCLAKSRHENAIVYLAAHGGDGEVGDVPLPAVFAAVKVIFKECNVNGFLIGSCYGAECVEHLMLGIQGGPLRWCAGYASSARWLQGTLVDCAILDAMLDLPASAYRKNGDKMIGRLGHAVSPFSPRMRINAEDEDEEVALADSLRFVIQPEGQGHQARDVSAEVFGVHALLQVTGDDGDDDSDEDD